MRETKKTRSRFGRFWFRFPNGESGADVYDRITSFRETLRNDMNEGRFEQSGVGHDGTVVIVSHGLTLRIFLMRWFKWSVSQFERVHNFGNAELVVLTRGALGRYSLTLHHSHEQLRTMGFSDEMIADQARRRLCAATAWRESSGA